MKKSILLFLLFIVIGGKLYPQDSSFPKNERRPYFNKFAYILDNDADNYFLAKAYKIVGNEKDNAVDFLLFSLENFDAYKMPIPENAQYDTEPMLATQPDSEYEYIIEWKNKNKSYKLNISNRLKEAHFGIIFKGMALQIKEEDSSYQLTKKVTVKTQIDGYHPYVEYQINKDSTNYITPPLIKDKDSLWIKLDSINVHPYIKSNIDYIDKKNAKQSYAIVIKDYFNAGKFDVFINQSLNITGNKVNAKRFLKSRHITIREIFDSRELLEMPSYFFNKDFETMQSRLGKYFDRYELGLPPKRKQIEEE